MDKSIKQVSDDVPNGASDTPAAALPKKRNFLRKMWVLALCLSVAGWLTTALLMDRTSWIGADGVLHEPLFGLIPISFFFLFVAIVLGILDATLRLRKRL